jgi:hypothetical protein
MYSISRDNPHIVVDVAVLFIHALMSRRKIICYFGAWKLDAKIYGPIELLFEILKPTIVIKVYVEVVTQKVISH